MGKEDYYHSWNGLFLRQVFTKGVPRAQAEGLTLYFKDSCGEIKRVDKIGFVTDAEGNHVGLVLKNDPETYGKAKEGVTEKEDAPAEEPAKNSGEKTKPKKTKKTANKEEKPETDKKAPTKRAKKTKAPEKEAEK